MAFELKLNISLCLENLLRDQQNMAPDRMHLDLASDLRLKDLHMNPGGSYAFVSAGENPLLCLSIWLRKILTMPLNPVLFPPRLLSLLWAVLKLVLFPPYMDLLLLSKLAMDLDLLRALKLNINL